MRGATDSTEFRVLFVTSEAYPLVKTGGLGDISGTLPAALQQAGVDARILLPAYPQVTECVELTPLDFHFDWLPGGYPARLLQGRMPDSGVPLLALDCPQLYRRDGGPYLDAQGKDWPDNHLRFAALSRAAALISLYGVNGFQPNIVHCNDWPAGLTPAYLRYHGKQPRPRSVITIHNMAYQGVFPPKLLASLGLPGESFSLNGLEFHGMISFLKAGLYYSDWINTVSETYAREILTPPQGHGLEGLMRQRRTHLSGILNGIDGDTWNCANDSRLFARYSVKNLSGKLENKRKLCKELGLNPDIPLLAGISRLTHQKGMDLLLAVIPQIFDEGGQVALLGIGDRDLETEFFDLSASFPGKFGFIRGYDEDLSHRLIAAADIFLMPSRFEPSGLTQMYAMRYGTPPVVRHTGGLADSVVDATPAALNRGTATGFVFHNEDAASFLHGIQRALLTLRDKATWKQIQRNGMERDFGWEVGAQKYLAMYRQILAN